MPVSSSTNISKSKSLAARRKQHSLRPDLDGVDKLLATAQRLFARHGYDGVSTKQIVAEAGLTTGALYHHFKGKEDLYEATIRRALATQAMLPSAIRESSRPAAERLAQLASWFVTLLMADRTLGLLLQRELLNPRAKAAALVDSALFREPMELFHQLLRELLPTADHDQALASLLALLFGFSNLKGIRVIAPRVSSILSSPLEIARHATTLLLRGMQT